MNWLIQIIGFLLFFTYFGLGLIWLESPVSNATLHSFSFSAITLYFPFILYGFVRNKTENYVKVIAIYFSSFASVLSVLLFFLYNYDIISFKFFWTLQIIIWTIVILLIVFSSIAEKNVRG